MAAVVDSIVSFTINKIGELVIQEVGYSYGVREKVESIQADLRWMLSLLRDADRRLGQGDERVKTLVGEVWGIACRVEDVVDTFRLREERRRRRGSIKKCIYALSDFISLRQIGRTIEAIKKEIGNMSARKTTYGTAEIDGGGGPSYTSKKLQDYRRAAALAEGKDIVGFIKEGDELVKRLTERGVAGDYVRRRVVSIVAPGGAGKTTLANRVYKSGQVRNLFGDSAMAWVCVSQTYNAKHLLQQIAEEVNLKKKQDSEGMSEKALQEELSKFLQEKRYLIILDDVWDTDAWDQLKTAFPDAKNGSRIIITTRNERVALYADPDPSNRPYHLPLLNSDDSWKLFLKKAFPWEETINEIPYTSSSSELVDVGKKIVKKCGGLPLAISAMGGLLAAKGEVKVEDWKNVLGSLKAELSGESVHCGDIIALSYYDLPYYLKPCFLYLGLFPEDYVIPVDRLKMLWIAEGFIRPKEGQENEDTAEDYLMEFVGRSLVQVGREVGSTKWGCRIHDLLHEFAISEGKKHNFLEICNEKVSTPTTFCITQARWLASHDGAALPQNIYTRNMRSLLCFDMPLVNVPRLSEGLKLLRVLEFQIRRWHGQSPLYASKDLNDAKGMERIGRLIKKLINLKSFELELTYGYSEDVILSLPSLEHHLNLSVLSLHDVRLDRLPQLPPTLTKLSLRRSQLGDDPMPTLEKLANLRVLSLEIDSYTGKKMISSGKGFPQLRYLIISFLHELEELVVEQGAMPKLKELRIERCSLKKLSEGFPPIATLKKFSVITASKEFKNWIEKATEGWYKNQDITRLTTPIIEIAYIPPAPFFTNVGGQWVQVVERE